jgi:hypothetical protein
MTGFQVRIPAASCRLHALRRHECIGVREALHANRCQRQLFPAPQVSALAIEPISSGTWLVVDGEKVPYTRLYAQVHAGLCNVLVAP